MRRTTVLACMVTACLIAAQGEAMAQLKAGVARASITPVEAGIPTQLGGYGERAGRPAEGVHDTIYAKAVVFEFEAKKSALVALDVCHLPKGLVDDALALAGIDGLSYGNVLMSASHSHAGLEGMSMDRRNIANNPHIGIFNEDVLNFVAARLSEAIKEANGNLRPVTAGSAAVSLPGMNRNRRDSKLPTDEDMTVLRFDTEDGQPYIVMVNYTAHGTIMTEKIMHVSGGWAGVMQRTVEDLVGEGVTCLYTNGAEGDVAPSGYTGGSRWEMAEQFGRRTALAAAALSEAIHTRPVDTFDVRVRWVDLPQQTPAPDFQKIAGDEYQVTEEQLGLLLGAMFPSSAPLYGLRINDFALVSFPGEPITAIGVPVKETLRANGIHYPVVACLTNDLIGYILTEEEYHKSGYEVTASFYGPGLGAVMLENANALATDLASK